MLPRHNVPSYDMPMEESGFGDPLENFIDGTAAFNIIQFIAENDTPVDSPLEGRSQLARAHQQPQDPHHGGRSGVMFQNGARLPDSPPITDISGPGSSASPSSNSDSPYSPENYIHYGVLHDSQNGNGLILGVNDLQNPILLQNPDLIHPQIHNMNSRLMHQGNLASPQSVQNFMSPYPPNQPTPATVPQVSPSSRCNSQYVLPSQISQFQNPMDIYQNINGSDSSLEPHSKKRRMPVGYTPSPVVPSPIGEYTDENFHHVEVPEGYTIFSPHSVMAEVIKFSEFQEETWQSLYDPNHRELSQLKVHIVADKGFNYSLVDQCFVNQKKNHFQITANIEAYDHYPPMFVKSNGHLKPVKEFNLMLCGVKSEMISSEIQIRQSTTDRKPLPYKPIPLEITERKLTKVVVPRLHFSETTMNNQRKNNKPNPDQKYFYLVIRLLATTEDGQEVLIQSFHSERVIVRATNPGQFEQPDSEMAWTKNGDTIAYPGKVVIGGDRTLGDAVLTVHGNMVVAGDTKRPSDQRLKENVQPVDPNEVLDRYQKYQIVTYSYKPEVAQDWGLDENNRHRAGMIAQQLQELYPDAVKNNGEFLTIDENRLFYDNMVVTQELVQLTTDLDRKIVDNVEELQKRIKYLMRKKQMLGSIASGLSDATSGIGDSKSYLSLSTTSLAEKDLKTKRHRNKRHCQNPSCHQTEPLCSSKLTQGTIVTLVVIMAFCLLAMSALYILDWHNRNHNYLPVYTATGPTRSSKDDIGHMIADNFWIPKEQPGVTPVMASCEHRTCQQYCCADSTKYHTPYDKDEESDIDGFVPMTNSRNLDKRSIFTRSAGKPLSSGVSIEILNMNMTIDERHCIDKSCCKKRARYNLYVPISAYLPNIQLQIKFHAPSGKFVNSCGYLSDFVVKPCAIDGVGREKKTPFSNQIGDDIFELSAGTFMQSAYRFRVGYTTESCFTSEDHQHGVYEEYNLVFYRTCSAGVVPTHETLKN